MFAHSGEAVSASYGGVWGVPGRFHFDWRLSDGSAAPFDVVDIATPDDSSRIAELTIIYDTHLLRAAFESASGKRSWHPAG